MGASAGGLHALSRCLAPLPASFPLPLLVAQHIHPETGTAYADLLQARCRLRIREAEDKEYLEAGVVYLAPPDYHLLVDSREILALSIDEKVNFSRPSIDVLFESASDVFGPALVGILLTGANHDGAHGLRFIKVRGGTTVVQDPATAEYDAMPRFALAETAVDFVLPLDEIGPFLLSVASVP
jgi:two-component system chemotaxis response regulator CheB